MNVDVDKIMEYWIRPENFRRLPRHEQKVVLKWYRRKRSIMRRTAMGAASILHTAGII